MKKIIWFVVVIVIWFLLVNLQSILSWFFSFKWNQEYLQNNFETAKNLYRKSLYFSSGLAFANYHNLWNTSYFIWEQKIETGNKIKLWEDAIENYQNAIKLKNDTETVKNKEFVEKKLQELKSESEQRKQENKENSEGGENSQNQEKILQKPEDNSDKVSKDLENIDQYTQNLSAQEKKALENYMESLQISEANYQQFFNKKYQTEENTFESAFEQNIEKSKDW